MIHDGPHFARRKGFACGLVAHRLQLLPQRRTATYPQHQTVHRRTRITARKVHHGQLPFGVRTYSKILFHNSQFSIINSQFNEHFAKVFAPLGQLMMLQIGQDLLQLQEESLARHIAVGKHVEVS